MRLLPRDEQFFDLFTTLAATSVEGAKNLTELFRSRTQDRWELVEVIKRGEHDADEVTHAIVKRLDRTFITPFDPEDIHKLASTLDDIMDAIDNTARLAWIFRIDEVPEGALLLCDVVHRTATQVLAAVEALKNGPSSRVLLACREIKRLEEEGDAMYHMWLARLFEEKMDALTVIKWKELYDTLEKTLDSAEDAANVLESVTLKHG